MKGIFTLTAVLALFFIGTIIADKCYLHNELIRLHVLADSNRTEDQANKLRVRDALLAYIEEDVSKFKDAGDARVYLGARLQELECVANETLTALGSDDRARVYLTKEGYSERQYDTFSLPSGVYESLRVEIGSAEGDNWWCVVFPSLCVPTSKEAFQDTAVAAGFGQDLTNTLSGEKGYEVRFFILDCIGRIENFFRFS